MLAQLVDLFTDLGLSAGYAEIASKAVILIGIAVVSFLVNLITKKILMRVIHRIVRRTKSSWDDVLLRRKVLLRLSHLAPAIAVYFLILVAFPENDEVTEFVQRLAVAYMIGVVVMVIGSILSAINDIYETYPVSKTRPIKGYIQVGRVVMIIVGVILMITTLLNKSPLGILGGIGAMSAVLLLVFKDSILGLVASIQLSANNMVAIGDWVEVPNYNANGDVIEINLQSIKVRNWDKTITTIPIYALVSDSFKNWKGMMESGGRRIKRSVNIDMRSIRLCTGEMIERYRRIDALKGYLEDKLADIEAYNREHGIDTSDGAPSRVNGRRITNIGTFRAYLIEYLRRNPKIRQDMTFLVRQLPPGATGLPIEIYVFSADQAWADYEGIQADIFDHVLAVVPEFGLRVFQEPSGYDLEEVAEAVRRPAGTG
jgi:miniconductance mechanosensitive channel